MIKKLGLAFCCFLLFLFTACNKQEKKPASLVHWQDSLDEKVFAQAKQEKKLVILNLEAVWCHWCHVMGEETYADPEVAKILNERYVPIKIDQDSNPSLSNRYKDWGWPATIIFDADGNELVKQAGFVEAQAMKELLNKTLANPVPSEDKKIQYSTTSNLDKASKDKLTASFYNSLDLETGGLAINQKYVDRDTIEYALLVYHQNQDPKNTQTTKTAVEKTLINAMAILDPAWGGFYQYSTHGDWQHPHFEKLTKTQAGYLRVYSLAYMQFKNSEYLKAMKAIVNYTDKFLTSTDGAFYSSQDADLIQGQKGTEYFQLNDLERRKKGIPRVDKNVYADRTGLMIEALVYAYRATLDKSYLDRAIKAAKTILRKNYNAAQKGFYHQAAVKGKAFYLTDNLYVTAALLNLYQATGNRDWLKKAISTGDFIIKNFKAPQPGYYSSTEAKQKQVLKEKPVLEENIKLARVLNLLYHYSAKKVFKDEAQDVMKLLGSPDIITQGTEPGILIVDYELNNDPVHFTVVGPKSDPLAGQLFKAALEYPEAYLRLEWYDSKEGKLINHDVEYPKLPETAIFSCINHACSLPMYSVQDFKDSLVPVDEALE